MKKCFRLAAPLALAAALATAAVPAVSETNVDINIGVPGVYVAPAPVVVQPRPVIVQPQPVYVQPQPVYVQPQPVYVEREDDGYWDCKKDKCKYKKHKHRKGHDRD